jgi:hypothetical protein
VSALYCFTHQKRFFFFFSENSGATPETMNTWPLGTPKGRAA